MEEILPDIYVDGAHNISAVEAFAESVPESGKGNVILFSAVRDKEYREMIACLCRKVQADLYVVTQIGDRRAAGAEALGRLFEEYTDRPVVVKESVKDALRYVMENRRGRTVYCLGSLYLTGEAVDSYEFHSHSGTGKCLLHVSMTLRIPVPEYGVNCNTG
mgnify:CR=1 FL=1